MKIRKKMAATLLPGAAVLVLLVGPAHALDFDPETLNVIDELIMKMQRETMQQQYAAMPIKNQLPNRMMSNMYQFASTAYRSNIQPQMVQGIVGTMQPWNFPNKFQQAMMPTMVGEISGQIKQMQLQFMQQGISDSSFPNVMERMTGQKQRR